MRKKEFFYFVEKYSFAIISLISLTLLFYALFPNNYLLFIIIPFVSFMIIGYIIEYTQNKLNWNKIIIHLPFQVFYIFLTLLLVCKDYLYLIAKKFNIEISQETEENFFKISLIIFIIQSIYSIIMLFVNNYDDVKKTKIIDNYNNEITNLKQNIEKLNERTTKLEDQKEIQ